MHMLLHSFPNLPWYDYEHGVLVLELWGCQAGVNVVHVCLVWTAGVKLFRLLRHDQKSLKQFSERRFTLKVKKKKEDREKRSDNVFFFCLAFLTKKTRQSADQNSTKVMFADFRLHWRLFDDQQLGNKSRDEIISSKSSVSESFTVLTTIEMFASLEFRQTTQIIRFIAHFVLHLTKRQRKTVCIRHQRA